MGDWLCIRERREALLCGADIVQQRDRVETCKINNVDPLAYLTDVLTRIVSGHPTVTSASYCPGPTALKPSKPWPENDAYDSSQAALPASI